MLITLYGVAAVTFMMTMYALERRSPRFILGFAAGCVLSSVYGFLSGAWPFRRGRADLVRHRRPALAGGPGGRACVGVPRYGIARKRGIALGTR